MSASARFEIGCTRCLGASTAARTDPQHAVADVAVLAEDVGERVVLVVVVVAPVVGVADDVPLVGAASRASGSFIQSYWPCITLWPISMFSRILAVASATTPSDPADGSTPNISRLRPAIARALDDAAHAADVARRRARRGRRPLSPRRASSLGLERGRFRLARRVLLLMSGSCAVTASSSSVALRASEMHSWINSSPGPEARPVRRLSTVPLRLRQVQVWQMPRRQP